MVGGIAWPQNRNWRAEKGKELTYLTNWLNKAVVFRMIRAAWDSSCWHLCSVNPSSMWPSWWSMTYPRAKDTSSRLHSWRVNVSGSISLIPCTPSPQSSSPQAHFESGTLTTLFSPYSLLLTYDSFLRHGALMKMKLHVPLWCELQ